MGADAHTTDRNVPLTRGSDRGEPIDSNKKVKPPVRPNLRTVDRLPGSTRGTTVRRSTGLWATRVGTRHRIGASPIRPYDCPPWDLLESMGRALSLRLLRSLLLVSMGSPLSESGWHTHRTDHIMKCNWVL